MKPQTKKRILQSFLILSIIGLALSIYLVDNHYRPPAEGAICDVGETLSCSLVNTSVFSEILNVPVALLGALWFVILFAFSWKALKKDGAFITLLFGWNVLGIFFVAYFVLAEYLLRALCLFCTAVHLIVVITFILSFFLYRSEGVPIKGPPFRKISRRWMVRLLIFMVFLFLAFNYPVGKESNYDALAQCVTEKGLSMYSSFRCGVCARVKEDFGSSFQYLNEIECHPQRKKAQTELCLAKGIEGTPTWILEPNGIEQKRYGGYLSPEEVAAFAGCEL